MNFNIQSDSRKIKEGDLFVALKTAEGDGHNFIKSAIKNGAKKIIASHGSYSVETIIVEDTRAYLEEYLITNFKQYLDEMNIIAFTGTNGKSTSALLMYQALNKLKKKCVSIGTIGYFSEKGKEFYLPNTSPDICDMYGLLMKAYNDGYRYVTIEASSHGLQDRRLEGIECKYGSFSNLTRDHLDFHHTFENYAMAKQILFKRIRKDGNAIVCIDSPHSDYFLLEGNNNITYGFNDSEIQVTSFKMGIEGSIFDLKIDSKTYTFRTKLVGKYNTENLVPIIIILLKEGFSIPKIQEVIPELEAPTGRIERIKFGTNNIFIDYAHTPDGLEKVVSTIKEVTKGDTYVVFCCRGNRDVGRRSAMMKAATDLSKLAIVTNDTLFSEDPLNIVKDMLVGLTNTNYEICLDRQAAIYKGIDLLNENDSLLILGHGHEETLVLENKKKTPFIERDIVEEYISRKELSDKTSLQEITM